MTGSSTLSSNCRRIYFAAQEFSNWVTEYNSDITNVRYILFYDERIGPGVRGKMITVHAIIYDCGTGATLSSNFIIPKTPGQITVEKNYRGVITTEEGVAQPKFLLLQYRSINIDLEINGILFNIIISNRRRVTYSALRRPNPGSRTLCFRRKDLDVGCHRF
jgi:hypothetical protein